MNLCVAPTLLVLTLLPLLKCETLTVTDVKMCCAVAAVLKRSFIIFREANTGNQCTVGPVVPNESLCSGNSWNVRTPLSLFFLGLKNF